MIPELRQDFNLRFRPEGFRTMLHGLDAVARTRIAFPVAGTPCFFPRSLLEEMAATGAELARQLVENPEYLARSMAAIPEPWRAAGQNGHPHFLTADFGLVRGADGAIAPRLVEMQGFPSTFALQWVLSEAYRSAFALDGSLGCLLGGHDETSFWKLLDRIIVAGHDPETVVLAAVDPQRQETLPDFHITADRLGIRIVDIAEMEPLDPVGGRPGHLPRLCYRSGRRLIPIRRIYNRVLGDELIRRAVRLRFDYREAFEVEWAGHPNWCFHIGQFSLPWLDHPAVPAAVFMDEWCRGERRERLPENRERWILKPLCSSGGQSMISAPTEEQLSGIPKTRRSDYLLQERITFEPVIDTPMGRAYAEIRILYAWPDGGKLSPVLPVVRLGRGQTGRADHTGKPTWVGASAAFFPPGAGLRASAANDG